MKAKLAILIVIAFSAGPAAGAPKLGKLYAAELKGFSIRPPAGVTRIRKITGRSLVRWIRLDAKTGKVRWTMEILRNRHKPVTMPAAEYAKVLARSLARSEQFRVESTEVSIIALKPAMHFRGVWSGALQLWRRQVWVPIGPEEHLVLDIAGPMADKAEMDAAMTASSKTLRLFDPKPAIKRRSESLTRGAEALKAVTDEKLKGLITAKLRYYLIELNGKNVGFLKITERYATRDGARGLWIIRGGVLRPPGKPWQIIHEDLFATADRSFEKWRSLAVTRHGDAKAREIRDGLKQQGVLLLYTQLPNSPVRRRTYNLPGPVRPTYLPAAFSVLLPRLLDRSKPGLYGFAVFNPSAEDFLLRNVEVVGAETIRIGERVVAATRIDDQISTDDAPTKIWVDAEGQLLRMETAQGLVTRLATSQEVIAGFAAELIELDKLR